MKKLVLACIFCISIATVMAQDSDKKWQFAVGPVAYMPTADNADYYKIGFGAEAEISYKFNDRFQVFGQSGYSVFSGKLATFSGTYMGFPYSVQAESPKLSLVPILVGGRYTINGFEIGGGIGYGIFTTKDYGSGGGFSYSPQIGYNIGSFKLLAIYSSSDLKNNDPNLAAVGVTTISAVGLKLFYKF